MKKVMLFISAQKDEGFIYTRRVLDILSSCGVGVMMDLSYIHCFDTDGDKIKYINENDHTQFSDADFIIVLGGDGTMMRAARKAAYAGIPVIGVNLGRVGYLAEIERGELNMLSLLFNGSYSLGERMMLDAEVFRGDRSVSRHYTALNDIVISNGTISKLVELELSCDGCEVSSYRADGIIAATPTGSTAYSMSAGGAIVDPKLECICLTPVCPHSLKARPLIFSSDSMLSLTNNSRSNDNIYMTVDGSENCRLMLGDTVRISKSALTTKLVKLKRDNFYNILHNKISE